MYDLMTWIFVVCFCFVSVLKLHYRWIVSAVRFVCNESIQILIQTFTLELVILTYK